MNTAVVIPFQKPQVNDQEVKGMYSDRFKNGYVMSSRLYRSEVRPFLSDAARNVYAELEDCINGHLKETDHVSHRQLQGGKSKGANKLGSATVNSGIKELIWFGVITVVEENKKIGNKYQINEISLSHYFEEFSASLIKALRFSNESTSVSEALSKVKQSASISDAENPSSASVSEATIDILLDSLELKKESPPVDNFNSEIFDSSVEYHHDDQKKYSFRELANVYTIKNDFIKQAQKIKSDLTDDDSISELKNFAQWTTTREATTAQGWMNYWIYRIQKLNEKKSKPKAPKTKRLSDWQIKNLATELCSYSPFAGEFSNHGEQQKPFETRITANLRKPQYVEKYYKYLSELGYAFEMGEFV
ncbi:hypothetical protein [Acinetobacter sp. WCHAc060025]|uniref:hypothetical protein n=1 Tax=Acinetobacter sp. WCHAc060025 TaxID=2518625 RepID=UPI0010235842|nr:hypothetical protein [Acinetobacter sp. WCHAc060025]RZG72435.1 hypothetical protein EXE09_17095 [Acinetobacter sp. WCHAc060025]